MNQIGATHLLAPLRMRRRDPTIEASDCKILKRSRELGGMLTMLSGVTVKPLTMTSGVFSDRGIMFA